ncbi:hypothetical protein HPG69_016441 [Diceros bicornis minor]|uniref:Taste receptor type 2 member 5 n=1 Tax=Diceros bicornis minor TaxID=77932 RepID=A0A7J7EF90_DICBM|nr:hypothetical protein HPG69_016441 [Diceros bicornis minor]
MISPALVDYSGFKPVSAFPEQPLALLSLGPGKPGQPVVATFLGVFYCKKITTFDLVYLWLKQRAYCLSLWAHTGLKPCNPSRGNNSILYPFSNWHSLYILRLSAGSRVPFTVFLVSSGMLIVSLYRHHRKMKVHTAGRRDARVKAHISVLQSLGFFLIFYMVYVLASPFFITSRYSPANLTTVFISETLMAAYPSLHSVILIMRNPSVQQICQRILWKTVCAWRSWGL